MNTYDTHYIFPARFQPLHNDHLKILKQVVKEITEYIFLGIIIRPPLIGEPGTKFEMEARIQNSPERNPFTPTERMIMVRDCIREELPQNFNKVIPVFLPRPEANWDIIKTIFEGIRIWIVPDVGEEFDDMKVNFFRSKGDQVYRIKITPTTDGYSIRKSLKSKTELDRIPVPSAIKKHIEAILGRRQL